MKTPVLIPCYKEALTIDKVVNDFQHELRDADIYAYDNNSSNDTATIAVAPYIWYFVLESHSSIHCMFTFREQLISVLALLAVVVYHFISSQID